MRTEHRQTPRIVRLKRETLRVLNADDLTKVGGGTMSLDPAIVPTGNGFIMKDSVIVKTSTR
jgi:hypothetical protein